MNIASLLLGLLCTAVAVLFAHGDLPFCSGVVYLMAASVGVAGAWGSTEDLKLTGTRSTRLFGRAISRQSVYLIVLSSLCVAVLDSVNTANRSVYTMSIVSIMAAISHWMLLVSLAREGWDFKGESRNRISKPRVFGSLGYVLFVVFFSLAAVGVGAADWAHMPGLAYIKATAQMFILSIGLLFIMVFRRRPTNEGLVCLITIVVIGGVIETLSRSQWEQWAITSTTEFIVGLCVFSPGARGTDKRFR